MTTRPYFYRDSPDGMPHGALHFAVHTVKGPMPTHFACGPAIDPTATRSYKQSLYRDAIGDLCSDCTTILIQLGEDEESGYG